MAANGIISLQHDSVEPCEDVVWGCWCGDLSLCIHTVRWCNVRASLTNVSAVVPVRPGWNAVAEEVLVPAVEHFRPGCVLIASGRARVGGAL